MTPSTVVDHLGDIQAHIIRSARPAAARYYFLGIRKADVFTDWLQQPLLQSLLRSEQDIRELRQGKRPAPEQPCFINIAFTFSGLQRLGLPQTMLEQFSPAFREGMATRAQFIGDYGGDAPEHWQDYYGSAHVHVLVALHYLPWLKADFEMPRQWQDDDMLAHDASLQSLWQRLAMPEAGARILMEENAHVIRDNGQVKEHFGFTDGISQPYIDDGMEVRRGVGGGKKRSADGPWLPLAPGEFLLGYQDELHQINQPDDHNKWLPDATDPSVAAFQRLTRNGSFLVHRKLEQDVAAFRYLLNNDSEHLGAKLMGRDQIGRPLTSPSATVMSNDFDYQDDPHGQGCPLACHMRRANPRLTLADGEDEGTQRVDQHRLIRRGMPYGAYIPPSADAAHAPAQPRGMHFFCYNSRIDSQFEFVQKNWLNQCDFMGFPSSMVDPIVGNRARDGLGQFCFNQDELPRFGLQQYVHLKGGEYFFSPGLNGLRLLLGLRQMRDPFWRPRQRIEEFDARNSDPFDVERYVDAAQLIAGKRFVKLWVEQGEDTRVPFYYFAHPQDLDAILNQPSLFTTAQYRQRIMTLTGADMMLSQTDTPQRQQQKQQTRQALAPAQFEQQLRGALEPELAAIRDRFMTTGQLDLVEGLARRLPLALVKHGFGIAAPERPADGIYSRAQIAHFFDRTDFAALPGDWQKNYSRYGFSTSADDTLLFWLRMLFLQVFSNVYSVPHIAELAQAAAQEFIPVLDARISQMISDDRPDGLLNQLIQMHRHTFGRSGRALVVAARQSVLELAVGSTDTTTKGIASVVSTLLQFGEDLPSAVMNLASRAGQSQLLPLLQQWQQNPAATGDQQNQIDSALEQLALLCLYQNPVAPLVPRYCLHGATYTTSGGEILNIEAGAVICLLPQITLRAQLQDGVTPNGKYLFMDGTVHGCLGKRIALLEIREALKLLLSLPRVRPAAGQSGIMQEKYRLPASMMLRCG